SAPCSQKATPRTAPAWFLTRHPLTAAQTRSPEISPARSCRPFVRRATPRPGLRAATEAGSPACCRADPWVRTTGLGLCLPLHVRDLVEGGVEMTTATVKWFRGDKGYGFTDRTMGACTSASTSRREPSPG